jgi:hypothetical protein
MYNIAYVKQIFYLIVNYMIHNSVTNFLLVELVHEKFYKHVGPTLIVNCLNLSPDTDLRVRLICKIYILDRTVQDSTR